MNAQQHLSKVERILASASKLSAERDYEMIIEAAMLAGTHLLNALLHLEGITTEREDVLHAEYMTVASRTRTQLALPGAVESLDAIEQQRPFFVRGNVAGGSKAARRSLELLDGISEAGKRRNHLLALGSASQS